MLTSSGRRTGIPRRPARPGPAGDRTWASPSSQRSGFSHCQTGYSASNTSGRSANARRAAQPSAAWSGWGSLAEVTRTSAGDRDAITSATMSTRRGSAWPSMPSSKPRWITSTDGTPSSSQAAMSSLARWVATTSGATEGLEWRPSVARTTATGVPRARFRMIVTAQASVSSSGWGASTTVERRELSSVASRPASRRHAQAAALMAVRAPCTVIGRSGLLSTPPGVEGPAGGSATGSGGPTTATTTPRRGNRAGTARRTSGRCARRPATCR